MSGPDMQGSDNLRKERSSHMVRNRSGRKSIIGGVLLGLFAAAASSEQLPPPTNVSTYRPVPVAAKNVAGAVQYLRMAGEQLLTLSANGDELRLQSTGKSGRTRSWPLPEIRRNASMTRVPDGRVLIWGGHDARGGLQAGGLWFDPELRALDPAQHLPMTARSEHTATVLTDGRVLFAGGKGSPHAYELWNPDTGRWSAIDEGMPAAIGHRAILQADGQVRLQSAERRSPGLREDLLFDPTRDLVLAKPSEPEKFGPRGLAGSLPVQGANNVAIDARLAVRFSEPVRLNDLADASFTLFGPGGATSVSVVAAENGRLAFATPRRELFPDSAYTLMVDGVTTQKGERLGLMTLDFRTAAITTPQRPMGSGPPTSNSGQPVIAAGGEGYCAGKLSTLALCQAQGEMHDGVWTPGQDNAGENWRVAGRQPELMPLGFMPALFEAWGKAALTGSILRADGQPVAGVAVSVGSSFGKTNAEGRFLLYDVPSGRQKVYVDGTAANAPGVEYGQFVVGVDIAPKTLTQVPFTMWLPRIAARDKIKIPSPTIEDMVLKHPELPGMELHIPVGTVIRDHKGKIVTEIAIVPTPVNRSPYPLPTNFPMYFTLQPGGAVLQGLTPEAGRGARVYYPNYDHHPAGTAADFWLYDAMEGWRVYGQGRVNDAETQFVPEDGVALREVVTFGAAVSPNDPAPEEGKPPEPQQCGECNAGTGESASAGDPIDLKTGRFTYQETDIAIGDVLPVALGRDYRPSDRVKREFGYGTAAGFAYRIAMKSSNYSELQLVLPNGSPLVFKQISGTGAYGTWRYDGKQGISGAILASENQGGYKYRLRMRDGSQMVFEPHSPNRILWSEDRFGNRVDYVYDAGLVSRITSPNGRYIDLNYDTSSRIISANDVLGSTWRYEYNAQGLLAKVIYPDQTFRRYEYQSWGSSSTLRHRLSAVYDQRGNRVLLNEYEQTGTGTATTTTGRVIRQTLADGAVYQIQYDHVDGSTTGTLVTHPDGSQRRVVFGDGMYPISDTLAYGSPLAQEYRFERDAQGRTTARIDPIGRRTEYEYDEFGQLVKTTQLAGTLQATPWQAAYTTDGQLTSMTDPLNRSTLLEYTNGCLTRATNPLGKSTTFTCTSTGLTESVTDALSNTAVSYYLGADLIALSNPLGWDVRFRHDALGRQVATQGPDGQLSRTEYDAMGRVNKIVSPDGGTTELAYDANGNTTDVLLPHQAGITYEYDSRDRLVKRTDSLGQSEVWTYDRMSRALTYTDRRGLTTHYTYDKLGRQETITYQDGTSVTSHYDGGGRLSSLVDTASGTLSWEYDDFDRMTKAISPQGVITYGYDVVGRRISMLASGQAAVEYRYDAGDRLRKILQGSEVVDYDYDDMDRMTQIRLPNGVEGAYAYDAAGQLTGLAWRKPDASSIGTLGFAYDGSGRIISQVGTLAPQALPTARAVDGFDDNNRLTQVNGKAQSFDANGNVTSSGGRMYIWNARNQLSSITQDNAVIASFGYDALGRRYLKHDDGPTITYLYDGLDAVQEISADTIVPILAGAGIDRRIARGVAMDRRYFVTDHLNSTLIMTDSLGKVVSSFEYDPYGNSPMTDQGVENPYRYTGRELDKSGLYYYRARYYSADVNRFISEDPLGISEGPNAYVYVNGDPVRLTDPFGLWSVGIEFYDILGGGINVSFDDGTLEVTIKGGGGIGGGLNLDPTGKPSPHSSRCGSGPIARTVLDAGIGAGFGPIGRSVNYRYALPSTTGPRYQEFSGWGLTGEPSAKPGAGIRAGASANVEFGFYTNFGR